MKQNLFTYHLIWMQFFSLLLVAQLYAGPPLLTHPKEEVVPVATTPKPTIKTTLSNVLTKIKSIASPSSSLPSSSSSSSLSSSSSSLPITPSSSTVATPKSQSLTPLAAKTPADGPLLVMPTLDTTPLPQAKNIVIPPANKNMQKIILALDAMPEKYKPADMKKALLSILQGSTVWTAVNNHKVYDALALHIVDPATARALQLALDGSIDDFWQVAHKSTALQEEITRSNVPFTRESCASKEYKMLFRMAYIRTTIQDPKIIKEVADAYQHAIIKLQWYLFAQSIVQENQVFTSGIITQPDQDLNMFHFLDGYSELISPRYRLYSGLSPHSLWQSKAYTRKSSHWNKKREFNDRNFGIDFKDTDGKTMPDLPGNKSHLLFGTLDNGHTFIKWEEYGITINFKDSDYSAFTHVVRYFEKKNVADAELHRREVVPKEVKFNFQSYSPTVTKQEKPAIKKDGVSAMLGNLKSDPQKHQAFTDYLTKFKGYDPETLQYRKGNEVILKPHAFVPLTQAQIEAKAKAHAPKQPQTTIDEEDL